MQSPHHRYLNDASFAYLVDSLYAILEQAQFTPSELREALIVAAVRLEEHRRRPIPPAVDKWLRGIE